LTRSVKQKNSYHSYRPNQVYVNRAPSKLIQSFHLDSHLRS
jgi:hypothetical protein